MNSMARYRLFMDSTDKNKIEFLNYYTSHHNLSKYYCYKPAYTVQKVVSTSQFGGTADWMYYQQTRLTPSSIQTIPLFNYTDHNGYSYFPLKIVEIEEFRDKVLATINI